MRDLIRKSELIEYIKGSENLLDFQKEECIQCIDVCEQQLESASEIQIVKNYIYHKPKVYRQKNMNWVVVRDILMSGTRNMGSTSCIEKCRELEIDPYAYEI